MRARSALLLCLTLLEAACSIPRWPVHGPLTSPFGLRIHGLWPEIHRGVDIGVPTGTPVHAMAAGRIRWAGTMRGYGKVVWIDHGGSVLSVYAHLSVIQVQTGQRVDGGETIGLSGSSGDATGPSLHFEIWRWGRQVDPVPLLGGPPGR